MQGAGQDLTETARLVRALTPSTAFALAFDDSRYVALPDDWYVAVTDVVRSREAIAAGRYKAVNMAGVAVISAVMNTLDSRDIPFIFGGDGAALAVAPGEAETVRETLAEVATFAREELELELRAALVPIAELRRRGHDVRVEVVEMSDAVKNFAFTGGGITEAERLMKAGEFRIEPAAAGARPDLTGLSCRWTPIEAGNGHIVSMIVEPGPSGDAAAFTETARRIAAEFGFGDGAGNPIPDGGFGIGWPVNGIGLEARAARGKGSLWKTYVKLMGETLMGWFLFKTNMRAGAFDPIHYRRYASLNTDFRKIQDGLRMTLLLSEAELDALEKQLEAEREQGNIRYGICVQDKAVITCYVPSVTEDSHMHFLDGAGGGYAEAASAMR